MPEFTLPTTGAERLDVRRRGRHPARGRRRQNNTHSLHLYISLLPAAVMWLLGIAAVAVVIVADPAATETRAVLVTLALAAVADLGVAIFAADVATRRERRSSAQPVVNGSEDAQRRLGDLALLIARGQQDLQGLAERLKNGETLAPRSTNYPPVESGDPVIHLARQVQLAQNDAWNAVLGAADSAHHDIGDQRVEVFVNLARRMQSLAHRAIQRLDELENQVEDPDLLKGLFKVDHLSTRMRRQAESLAVIGGATSRRQWSRPVTVYEVLRSAIAEIEHYNRVKVVPTVEGTLHGSAVADIIHLLAELVENATKFSPPHTQVFLRAEAVTAGLAIEIEDRGLGIPREAQNRLNGLLSDFEGTDRDELLQDGRIGLLVVSALARRHGAGVRLQTNLYGGTQAAVVIPKELIGPEGADSPPARAVSSEPMPAVAAPASPAATKSSAVAPAPPSGQTLRPKPAPGDVPDGRLGEAPAFQERSTASRQRFAPPGDVPASGPASWREDSDGRPPLPRRQPQANLAPELRTRLVSQDDDQEVAPNPGLMAAFRSGMQNGREEDGAPDGADNTS